MHILVIEDDKITNQNICLLLKKEKMIPESAHTGHEGIELIKLYDYDLIILDLMLPDKPGLEILKQIRLSGVKTPVLVLSGLHQTEKKVDCLNNGADDYLTKPYERAELLARVKSIIRRSSGLAESVIRIANMTIDMNKKNVFIDNQLVPLTAKEYALLELLALKKGITVSKETCLNQLYGIMDEPPDSKIIDVFLCKMRRKIKKMTNGEDFIQNVWGRGYILKAPDKK
jgi:two-component system cell cycle response regulator CtrA